MSQRTDRTAKSLPPLWVWAVTVSLLLVTFVFYKLFFEERVERVSNKRSEFFSVNTERLRKFADGRSGGAQFRVVLLGTSLTRFATYPEQDSEHMEIKFIKHTGLELCNISKPAAILDDFAALHQEIIQARPDVLIIQDDLLRSYEDWSRSGEIRNIVRINIEGLLFKEAREDNVKREWQRQENRECGGDPVVVNVDHSLRIAGWYAEQVKIGRAHV